MTYYVRFTDSDKSSIAVYDNTSNNDTSLVFPGRNVTNYGSIVAENFLHLLENFASAAAPVAPVEGQLWYDSSEETLKISDGVSWKTASGIYKGAVEPSLESSRAGELWIDTVNQQLKIFNGAGWILVGPNQTSINGLKYGPSVETLFDTDNVSRTVVIVYIADIPLVIISKDTFTPKITIAGFDGIKSGVNLNQPTTATDKERFEGGNIPKVIGTATAAESLIISTSGTVVPATKVLRTDIANTVEAEFKVRNNTGVVIGVNQNFNLAAGPSEARIYNSIDNGSISLQISRSGVPNTILKIADNKVGINNQNPQESLDVIGNQKVTGSIITTSTAVSSTTSNGSIVTSGGVGIAKNLIVGTNVILNSASDNLDYYTQTKDLIPEIPPTTGPRKDGFDIGKSNRKWNEVHAKTVVADRIRGVLEGILDGTAVESSLLTNETYFQITGDIAGYSNDNQTSIKFNRGGGGTITFNTVLTSNIIAGKNEPPGGESLKTDEVLIYRPSGSGSSFSGLLKQSRDNFIADLGIPIGAILPYAGLTPPDGFMFCDGSEVLKSQYPDLYSIIGDYYNGTAPLATAPLNTSFRLPDLRGRFPLGRDNMDNGGTVPSPTGGVVNAGGGSAGRVTDAEASGVSGAKGSSTKTLSLENLPDHSHSLTSSNGQQFYAVRNDAATVPGTVAGAAGTSSGQARLLPDSGNITKPSAAFTFGRPIDAMNPYLTLNYIIRSGPPVFTVT